MRVSRLFMPQRLLDDENAFSQALFIIRYISSLSAHRRHHRRRRRHAQRIVVSLRSLRCLLFQFTCVSVFFPLTFFLLLLSAAGAAFFRRMIEDMSYFF
jgi:hypothetical protein